MMVYVKICPKCGKKNAESEYNCGDCGYTLIMEEAVPQQEEPSKPNAPESNAVAAPSVVSAPPESQPASPFSHSGEARGVPQVNVTQRMETPGLFFLEIPNGPRYEIRNGFTVGQSHPTSSAHIQLSGLEGVNFIHRQHCRFDFANGQWLITPLPQPDFTNPTHLNSRRLQAGQAYPVQNGDRLVLGSISLNVRII